MDKFKVWLKITRNKIILGVVVSLLIVTAATTVYILTRPKKPTITFIKDIVLEYGQVTDYDIQVANLIEAAGLELNDNVKDIKIITATSLLPIKAIDLIDSKESKFDSLAFDSSSLSKTEEEKETSENEDLDANGKLLPVLNTKQIGKSKGRVFASLGNEIEVFEFEYEVKDTHMPQFDAVANINTPFDVMPEFSDVIKASDLVDGELEVIITEDIDYTVSGVYQMKAGAMDKNDNVTLHEFTITVAEEIIIPDPQENNSSGSNNNNNTGNTGNSGNTGNNNSGNTSPGTGNTGGTQTPPVTPPVAPPIEENLPPAGMLLYKDYGNFQACAAAIDDVADAHWDVWLNSVCFDDGTLYYRPN